MKKRQESKSHYTIEQHAIRMFRENAKYFSKIRDEFDILPFSKSYYSCNRDCFIHKDEMEIYLFVRELMDLGYLEKTGDNYNIVTITEKGHTFLNNWNSL